MSNLKVNTINDANGGSAAVLYGVASPPNSMGFRNRIINGDMRIDQRNAGASVTPTAAVYSVDRWNAYCNQASKFSFQQNAGSVTPPSGFSKYLGVTSLSAYTLLTGDRFFLAQPIEGFNAADLAWGTASAQAVTVSFWVRSSLTGTFGGAVTEYLGTRSYPFTYTISAANTWEQKTVTIPGDTAGTWGSTNSGWGQVSFGLGCGATYSGTSGAWAAANYNSATGAVSVVGTSGATFYITGVQLEAGTVATPFERRDYGRELMMCQRYFWKTYDIGVVPGANNGIGSLMAEVLADGSLARLKIFGPQFPVVMRTQPTVNVYTETGTSGSVNNYSNNATTFAVSNFSGRSTTGLGAFIQLTASAVQAASYVFQATANAEL